MIIFKMLKTDLEVSSLQYQRSILEARGCRCVDLVWTNAEFVAEGTLHFNLLKTYKVG